MDDKTKQGVTMITRNIPPELRKKMKMLCVDEGVSVNAKMIELITNYTTLKARGGEK